ncbi:MAG: hypothetical protein CSA49_06045 [Gammaproteobacteria bacterium]|nr:MAG: hypothetical protein CSA49_06045 [Gammaproteobacteria bacterium]
MGNKSKYVVVAVMLTAFLSGCSQNFIRDTVASRMVGFNYDYATPWFMASSDTDVMCAMGEGMGAIIYPMGPNADPLVPLLALSAGQCADEKSKEEELRYIRAMRENDVEDAQDARTQKKRWLSLAAQRQYFGYQAMLRYFGEPGGECPEFEDKNYEMSYLFGLLVGLQAFQSDFATGGQVGVPTDTVAKVISGMKCVDSDEYWGLPDAVSSLTGIMLAAAGDDKEALAKGYATLDHAAKVGEASGVRMVQALQAQMYLMQSKPEKAKQVIRDFVESSKRSAPNPDYRFMDLMATRNIRYISDKLWTEATGQRTPFGKLGTFWDDKPALEEGLDIDDLL